MQVFKIRRRTDGLFSTGGSHPHFTHLGKVWKRRGDVTNHIHQVRGYQNVYNEADVIEYTVIETPEAATPVVHWHAEAEARKVAKEAAAQARREEIAKSRRRAEYEKLQKEFG